MTNEEAVNIIQSIIDSLRSNPEQFNFEVKISSIGAVGIGGSGGAGIVGIANGGGIGVQASASAPSQVQIEFAEKNANAEINKQAEKIFGLLSELIHEFRKSSPSESKTNSIISSLKKTWIPGVLINVISQVASAVLLA